MPDGGQHAGVRACEKRPSAHRRDWTQATTCLFPFHGNVPRGLHACTKTRTGGAHMKRSTLFCVCELESVSVLQVDLDVLCVVFTENGRLC